MDCDATLMRKCRRFSVAAVALSVILLTVSFGFAEQSANAGSETVETSASPSPAYQSYRAFSKLAVGINIGTFGPGIELVTPITYRSNLRVDGSFFNYSGDFNQDGVGYNANLHLRDVRATYDLFPFHKGFRISAGIAVYNQFNVLAAASVPGGNTITLNDLDYYSSGADPLHGSATMSYSRKVAPTISLGWGNAIPRSGRHLSFPIEIGAAFTGTPKFDLTMAGSACATPDPTTCQPVGNYADFNTNLDAERKKINDDIAPLRFYPIINAGITYRF